MISTLRQAQHILPFSLSFLLEVTLSDANLVQSLLITR